MRHSLLGGVVILACSAAFAFADAKNDIQTAVSKLAASDSYSWTNTIVGGAGAGTVQGKQQKGLIALKITFRNNDYPVFIKGDHVVIKTSGSWKFPADIIADSPNYGPGNPDFFPARLMKDYTAPAALAAGMLDKLQNAQIADGIYSADLTEPAANQLLVNSRWYNLDRTALPDITNDTAAIKFWITDGSLTKYEIHVTGTVSFNGRGRDVDRTITAQFTLVGSTTVDVPPDALAMLNVAATQPAAQ